MTLNKQNIAYNWVQAQIVAQAHQQRLNQAFQLICPDNQIFDLDSTNAAYTHLVETIVGPDAWSWIEWWCWECDYGREARDFQVNHQWYNTTDMTFHKFWELVCE